MPPRTDTDEKTIDLAARAGWMYYLAGMTQDQIARELGVSRQRAQRLVARAMAEGLVKVRLDHSVSACVELELAIRKRFDLQVAAVAPSLPQGIDPLTSLAPVAARVVERYIDCKDPLVISLGTGRTLRAVVAEISTKNLPQHKIVSLIGNVALDGSASVYEVILRMADRIGATHFPLSLPVASKTVEEHTFLMSLPHVQNALTLARECDLTIVGIGQVGPDAPMVVDGFFSKSEVDNMIANGAVGELVGWAYDSNGNYLEDRATARTNGVRVESGDKPVIGIAAGESKHQALVAALKGKLINGLVTDEFTARFLLSA